MRDGDLDERAERVSEGDPGERETRVSEGDLHKPGEGHDQEEERAARLREELKRLRVADVAGDMMITLVTLGYQKLGLTDETRELRDLGDAHLAIELLRVMIDVVAQQSNVELKDYRATLASMQVQYAKAVESELAERGGSAGGRVTGS